jgi:mannose-6-phosphate isomerase-like protein (cupin superfamily)
LKIRSRDRAVPYQTKDGSLIRSIMDLSNSPVENLSLAEATVNPGSKSRLHLHTRSEEIYYLLQGKGRIYIEGKSREVARFDAILIPPGTKHYIENVGQEDLIFLCLCSPPYTHQATKILGNILQRSGLRKSR